MSDEVKNKISIQSTLAGLETSPQFAGYSKIIIDVSDDSQIVVGDDSGETLEYYDPFGTEAQALAQLEKLRQARYQYQPYKVERVFLDPAAEIGDGVSAGTIYGGLYKREKQFDRVMRASIEAPHGEEINHEYKFTSPTERKYKRQIGEVKASLIIQNDLIQAEVAERTALGEEMRSLLEIQSDVISAKVSKTGGESSSFSWELLDDSFSLKKSNNKTVFKADSTGVEIDGKVTAQTGYIGDPQNGFTITATAIYNNLSRFGGTQTSGIYLGTDGIQLGQNFKVDPNGNLVCKNATVDGTLHAKAMDIQYGGSNGTFSGSGITGGSIGTGQLNSYCGGGIYGGVSFNGAVVSSGGSYPSFFRATSLSCSSLQFTGGTTQVYVMGGWRTFRRVQGNSIAASSNFFYVLQ